ncbi:MAG: CPBP family glutamic-type intramembrane protease [Anaerolineae bacterium]
MLSSRQIVLIAAPVVLLGTTYLVFQTAAAAFGPKLGYLTGFIFYWLVWCLVLPWWALGTDGLLSVFRDLSPRFGNPSWLGIVFLIVPLLLGYGYAFPRALGQANLTIILLSFVIALVNGTLEELLWRGTYVTLFPDSWILGYAYPAIGFAVWHFAPQSVFPSSSPGGNVALVAVAGAVGLMWGWVARQSGSILWTTISHVLFNFSGLGARVYFR